MVDLARQTIDGLGRLIVTQGEGAGEPLVVLPWQRRFIAGALQTRTAALSVSRGAGKTTITAALSVAALVGPLRQPRGEVVIVAASFDQAKILFGHALAFLKPAIGADPRRWIVRDSSNVAEIEDRQTGSKLHAFGCNPDTIHGRAGVFLADEPAKWPKAKSDKMRAALRTALGKVPQSRFIALGTRPAGGEHWFQKMLDGGAGYSQMHAARKADPPFQMRTWRRANPSIDHMPELLATYREEARDAKRDPSELMAFKALRLNLGTEETELAILIEADLWASIEGEAERAGHCVWGLDLGTSAAQSAVAASWPATGRLEALAAFPSEPSLEERGLKDGVGALYRDCARRGELIQTGGKAVALAPLFRAALARFGPPAAIASDRWRVDEAHDALAEAGVPVCEFVERGQGYRDGGEDVRLFNRACLEGRVVPVVSLLMRAALLEARTAPPDPAGNVKLAKMTEGGRRLRARDDAAAAAILAVAQGRRMPDAPAPRWRYRRKAG